uniref:Clathrin light chain n=1 Tax=Panagrellus redivivus TaxID=6233 RepID=A0A7E4V309_PANRE
MEGSGSGSGSGPGPGSGSGSVSIEMGYDDIYGPYDPIFAIDDFDRDVHQNRLLTSMIVNPDPSNEYYAALLSNQERLKDEKARLEKINKDKARFDSQRNLYAAWMEKKWQHFQVCDKPFKFPQPKVDKDVLEHFEKLKLEAKGAEPQVKSEAVLRFEANVDVPPLEFNQKAASPRWNPATFRKEMARRRRRHDHELAAREGKLLASETDSSVQGDADMTDDSMNV